MKYPFPKIETLDDVLPAIEGRDEFIVAERDWGFVLNYLVNKIDTFPRMDTKDPHTNLMYSLRRECRGLKFGLDRKIIARPFHKFFNLDERPETLITNINWNEPFHVLQKLDGSMLHPIPGWLDDRPVWCTKMGPTDVATPAGEFALANGYNEFAKDLMRIGHTPLFEWTSRQQRIVVDYPVDNMILLAVRNNVSGEYMSYADMTDMANNYGLPSVETFNGTFDNITAFLDDIQAREGEEGYVLCWNGHKAKAKNLWYLQLHKTKELLQWEKDVIALILSEKHDDAKAFMDDEAKQRIDMFAEDLNIHISKSADDMKWIAIAIEDNFGPSRKKMAAEVLANHKEDAPLLFKMLDGHDSREIVLNKVLDNTGTGPKVETIRHLIGGIKWEDY